MRKSSLRLRLAAIIDIVKKIRSKRKAEDPNAKICQLLPKKQTWQDPLDVLPIHIVDLIFSQIYPHAYNDTLLSTEECMAQDKGCVLCDLKDLAQCSLVSRTWNRVVQNLLYQHVRIEAVHYCERESELAKARKHKSLFNANAIPKDAPTERLTRFMNTVRCNQPLAALVLSLRLPYVTRETCKAQLAATVRVLSHLRYIDLPEGFYSNSSSTHFLTQELQVSCPRIQRMKYSPGSEHNLVNITKRGIWRDLSVLELCGIRLDSGDLGQVLSSLTCLRDLKLVDLPWLESSIFRCSSHSQAQIPPLIRLTLFNTPLVASNDLHSYLLHNGRYLTHLSLSRTGVLVHQLCYLVLEAPCLESLTIVEDVNTAVTVDNSSVPLLSSISLKNIHFEITSTDQPQVAAKHLYSSGPSEDSYYEYLINSIVAFPPVLPALREVHVHDLRFLAKLMLAASPRPSPHSTPASNPAPNHASRFTYPLTIFSRDSSEQGWNFISVSPKNDKVRRRPPRPVTMMGTSNLGSNWMASARQSVIIGDGLGGFLAEQSEIDVRPTSRSDSLSNSSGRKERRDLWR